MMKYNEDHIQPIFRQNLQDVEDRLRYNIYHKSLLPDPK
jgi:hypothetical protein